MVKPVEEIVLGVGSLPFFVIDFEVGAVAVLVVDHFEKVLQPHGAGGCFAAGFGLGAALLEVLLLGFGEFFF